MIKLEQFHKNSMSETIRDMFYMKCQFWNCKNTWILSFSYSHRSLRELNHSQNLSYNLAIMLTYNVILSVDKCKLSNKKSYLEL